MKRHYRVDQDRRLLIRPQAAKKHLIAEGRFSTDKNNRLTYWLNEPVLWRKQHNIPPRIVFKGSWRLNREHDLELVLDKNKSQFAGEALVIKGSIIGYDRDILAFEVKSYDRAGLLHIRILKLSAICFADGANRLSFIVKKQPGILTLQGDWQLNKNQQITYTYEKTDLKRKTKITNTLTFEGFWKIDSVNKLTYILKHSTNSRFDFRAQIETPTLYPQEGLIRYRLGAGLREEKRKKIICLYGAWKFSRALGLIFQVDYGKGEIRDIEFAADVAFNKKNEIILGLKNREGESLGISLVFTHRFLKSLDAQAFLRLKASREQFGIDAGVTIPF
jgi:hypothetical protein